jgi:hypothetical protein
MGIRIFWSYGDPFALDPVTGSHRAIRIPGSLAYKKDTVLKEKDTVPFPSSSVVRNGSIEKKTGVFFAYPSV